MTPPRDDRWYVVRRSDCRPDERCVGCGMEMGDHHAPLCYVRAEAYRAWSDQRP